MKPWPIAPLLFTPLEGETAPELLTPLEGETAPLLFTPLEGETAPELFTPLEGETAPELFTPLEGETAPLLFTPLEGETAPLLFTPLEGETAPLLFTPLEGETAPLLLTPLEGETAARATPADKDRTKVPIKVLRMDASYSTGDSPDSTAKIARFKGLHLKIRRQSQSSNPTGSPGNSHSMRPREPHYGLSEIAHSWCGQQAALLEGSSPRCGRSPASFP